MEAGGGVHRRRTVASCTAPTRMMACPGATDAVCPVRLALPLGQGEYEQVQGIKGARLDMVDKRGGQGLGMATVEWHLCHGMLKCMHKDNGQGIREAADGF